MNPFANCPPLFPLTPKLVSRQKYLYEKLYFGQGHQQGPTPIFSLSAFNTFLAGVKAGQIESRVDSIGWPFLSIWT
jgi:hypothetical protein